jgi:hypothetical protein
MKDYTVIGVYENTGEAFADHVTAMDAYSAMTQVADGPDCADDLCIIGAVLGHHVLDTPGDDNMATAYAPDLKTGG